MDGEQNRDCIAMFLTKCCWINVILFQAWRSLFLCATISLALCQNVLMRYFSVRTARGMRWALSARLTLSGWGKPGWLKTGWLLCINWTEILWMKHFGLSWNEVLKYSHCISTLSCCGFFFPFHLGTHLKSHYSYSCTAVLSHLYILQWTYRHWG